MNELQIKKLATKVKIYGDLDTVIQSLNEYKENEKNVYVDFNGKLLYSLLDTVDSCYLKVTGMTKQDYIKKRVQFIFERNKRNLLENEKKQENIKTWISDGKELIFPQKFNEWERCVQGRANDIYKGFDVENAIQVMKVLDSTSDFSKAREIIFKANHSGSSYGMVMNILINFAKNGPEFYEYLEPEVSKIPKNADYLKRIKKENLYFENLNKNSNNMPSQFGE